MVSLCTAANFGAGPIHSVRKVLTTVVYLRVDALADKTTPEYERPLKLCQHHMRSPAHVMLALHFLLFSLCWTSQLVAPQSGHPFFVLSC